MSPNAAFDVTKFGAQGDGRTNDGAAIAAAIAACANTGGGRVLIPAGTYLTGPIELKSHVELHLEADATVLFSRNFDDYPLVKTHFEGEETVRCTAPLWGEALRGVSITGKGTFDGQGQAWRHVKRVKLTPDEWNALRASGGFVDEARGIWWPTRAAMEGETLVRELRASGRLLRLEDYRPARDFLRPNMVKLVECQDILFDGPTFTNSPCWNIHLLFCQNVTVRNLTILNPWYAQNGDGLDIESCRNVTISDCYLDVGDDAICLKSGKDEQGRRRNRPCENIVVQRCTVIHGHGGLTIGSEMSGGVRNVQVSDCIFRGTDIGLRFKTARGRGGVVEDISIRDITMSDIKGAAISFDMYYMGHAWGEGEGVGETPSEPINEGTPQFRQIAMRNVTCDGAQYAMELRGLPEMPIESISLHGGRFQTEHGVVMTEAQEITLCDVQLETLNVPALRIHNVRGLTLERLDCTTGAPNDQEALVLQASLSAQEERDGHLKATPIQTAHLPAASRNGGHR